MFEEFDNRTEGRDLDDALQLVEELERNTSDEVRKQRSHARFQIKATVTVQPGNTSDRSRFQTQGSTVDVSEGGGKTVLADPCRVGDVYLLTFDRRELDVPITFARCVRCSLIRENAFEVGFRFFAPVELPVSLLA